MLCDMTFVIVQCNHIHPVRGNSMQAREKNGKKPGNRTCSTQNLTTKRLTRDQNALQLLCDEPPQEHSNVILKRVQTELYN